MSSVLLVTRDFPPYSAQVGGTIRMVELANFFVRKNFQVSVISLKKDTYCPNLLFLDERVKTCYLYDDTNFPMMVKRLVSLQRKLKKKFFKFVKKRTLIDSQHMDLGKYKAAIKKAIKLRQIDTVIISSPPCSLRILSIWLKKKYGSKINVIADYRDSWTLRNKYIDKINKKEVDRRIGLEQLTLKNNDLTVFVSSGMMEQYKKTFTLKESVVVQNGYIQVNDSTIDEKEYEKIKNSLPSNKIIIGFFGSGSVTGKGHKDFLNLIEVLQKNSEMRDSVAILTVGKIKGLEELNINFDIFNAGIVNYGTARKLMELIDIGIVVHSEKLEAPSVMGGKLYDYIASKKPIWFIVPENAYSIKEFFHKHNRGYLSNVFDKKDIENDFREVLSDFKMGILANNILNNEEQSFYSRDNQYSLLLSYMN